MQHNTLIVWRAVATFGWAVVGNALFAIAAYAQCGVTMSCVPASPQPEVPTCNLQSCLANEEARRRFERNNNCVIATKCSVAVKQVKDVLKRIPKTDPTYGFYRNQDCIASKACAEKRVLDNPAWLDEVVYNFVAPLVGEEGQWKSKKADCTRFVIAAGLQCQSLLASYHIDVDLQNSVNKNGCGSQKDWDRIGGWLTGCVNQGIADDLVVGSQWAGGVVASVVLAYNRSGVRENCLAYRGQRKLSLESNNR